MIPGYSFWGSNFRRSLRTSPENKCHQHDQGKIKGRASHHFKKAPLWFQFLIFPWILVMNPPISSWQPPLPILRRPRLPAFNNEHRCLRNQVDDGCASRGLDTKVDFISIFISIECWDPPLKRFVNGKLTLQCSQVFLRILPPEPNLSRFHTRVLSNVC